jgi:hypothetical protein
MCSIVCKPLLLVCLCILVIAKVEYSQDLCFTDRIARNPQAHPFSRKGMIPVVKKPIPMAQRYILSKLYFGLDSPIGWISDIDFQKFVDETVTPLFPEGVTLYSSSGQYLMKDGTIVKEPSKIIEILHFDNREKRSSVDAVMQVYKDMFQQESVMLMQSRVFSSTCNVE